MHIFLFIFFLIGFHDVKYLKLVHDDLLRNVMALKTHLGSVGLYLYHGVSLGQLLYSLFYSFGLAELILGINISTGRIG